MKNWACLVGFFSPGFWTVLQKPSSATQFLPFLNGVSNVVWQDVQIGNKHHIQFQLRVINVLCFHCFPRSNWSSNFKTKRFCLYCSNSVLNSCHELRTVRLQVMRYTAHYGQRLSSHIAVTVSSRQICLPSYPLFCTVVLCSIPARLISPKYFSFQYNAHCFWKTSESITSGSIWAQISHSACSKGAKVGHNN